MKKNFLSVIMIFLLGINFLLTGCKNQKEKDISSQPEKKSEITKQDQNQITKQKYIPSGKYYGVEENNNILEITRNELEENSFDINLSIYRLSQFDGPGNFSDEDDKIKVILNTPGEVKIAAEIIYDEKNHELKLIITDSQWELLKNGEEFIFDARNYPADTQAFYDLFKKCTGYQGSAGASIKNAKNAFELIKFVYQTRFYDLDNQDEIYKNMSDAYKKLNQEEKAEFDANFDNAIRPLALNVFKNYSSVRQDFYDAGLDDKLDFYINYNERFNINLGLDKLINNYYVIISQQNKK